MAGTMPFASFGSGPLCLLSIDHNHLSVFSTLHVLDQLMKRVNSGRYEAGIPSVKPCEVFDLIGGAGLGGVAAIMLGRLEMDVGECIATVSNLSRLVSKALSTPGTRLRETADTDITVFRQIHDIVEETIDMGQPFDDGISRFVTLKEHEERHMLQTLRSYKLSGARRDDTPVNEIVTYLMTNHHRILRTMLADTATDVVKEALAIWGTPRMANVHCFLSVRLQEKRSSVPPSPGLGPAFTITAPMDDDSGSQIAQDDPLRWLKPIDTKCYHHFDMYYSTLIRREEVEEEVSKYFNAYDNAAKISDCVRSLKMATGKSSSHPMYIKLIEIGGMLQQAVRGALPPIKSYFGSKPCYFIIAFMALVILASALFGVLWTVFHEGTSEMGNAFTTAGYIAAVGALIAVAPTAKHYPHCKCWDRGATPYLQGPQRVNTFELGHLAPHSD